MADAQRSSARPGPLEEAICELRSAVGAWWPGAVPWPIGSSALGLPLNPDDDVDVVIVAPAAAETAPAPAPAPDFPEGLARDLVAGGWTEVVAVSSARVPIVRAVAPGTGRRVDAQLLVLPPGCGAWTPENAVPPDDWSELPWPASSPVEEVAPAVCALRLPALLVPPDAVSRTAFLADLARLRAWARSRAVYGTANGFPPGVAWAVLLAAEGPAEGAQRQDRVLAVLRNIAERAWGTAESAVRARGHRCAKGLPPWLPPALPAVQQPMAVLTPDFEQNTTTAVTHVHLEVLVDECRHAVAIAEGGSGRPWLVRAPRQWFTHIVAARAQPETAARTLLLIHARMPLVAMQLASTGLAVRPLGSLPESGGGASPGETRTWVFGVAVRSSASVALRSDQLVLLLTRCARFLHAKLASDAQVGPADAAAVVPTFEAFGPRPAWPKRLVRAGITVPDADEQGQGQGQTRDGRTGGAPPGTKRRRCPHALPQIGRMRDPAFGPHGTA